MADFCVESVDSVVTVSAPVWCSNIPGTWAFSTMTSRVPMQIIPRIISDNPLYTTELLELQSRILSNEELVPIDGTDKEQWEVILSVSYNFAKITVL